MRRYSSEFCPDALPVYLRAAIFCPPLPTLQSCSKATAGKEATTTAASRLLRWVLESRNISVLSRGRQIESTFLARLLGSAKARDNEAQQTWRVVKNLALKV